MSVVHQPPIKQCINRMPAGWHSPANSQIELAGQVSFGGCHGQPLTACIICSHCRLSLHVSIAADICSTVVTDQEGRLLSAYTNPGAVVASCNARQGPCVHCKDWQWQDLRLPVAWSCPHRGYTQGRSCRSYVAGNCANKRVGCANQGGGRQVWQVIGHQEHVSLSTLFHVVKFVHDVAACALHSINSINCLYSYILYIGVLHAFVPLLCPPGLCRVNSSCQPLLLLGECCLM